MSGVAPHPEPAVLPTTETAAKRRGGLRDPRLDALSAGVAGLVADYGRSPTSATSLRVDDNCVVTALADFLTPGEQELVERGDAELVRQLRSALVEATRDEYLRVAERVLGREVIAHHSEVICAASICLEIFLLGNVRGRASASPLDADLPDARHRAG